MLKEVGHDPLVGEHWIDLLLEHWDGIRGDRNSRKYLPEILASLSGAVVTNQYLNKFASLMNRYQKTGDAISLMLKNAFISAQHHIDWMYNHFHSPKLRS